MEFWIVCLVYWLHSNKEDCQPDFSLWFPFMWDPVITIKVFPGSHSSYDLRNSEGILLHYNVVVADTRNLILIPFYRNPKADWGDHLNHSQSVHVCATLCLRWACMYECLFRMEHTKKFFLFFSNIIHPKHILPSFRLLPTRSTALPFPLRKGQASQCINWTWHNSIQWD